MTTGEAVYLIDTNVLIYAYDAADATKMVRAREVLRRVRATRTGALSVQILGEMFTNLTRKPLQPFTADEAQATAIRYCRSWPVLDLNDRTFLDAVGAVFRHRLSYWDSLVWATARQHGVPYILTEDQQHNRLVGEIRYLNPFLPDFDMARLS